MLRLTILILATWLASAEFAAAAGRVAFVVGNKDYERLTPLKNTLNDAEALKHVLETRLGFTVIYAPDSNAADMKAKIEEFGLAATGADIALFYYAGHAVEFNEANFLMPIDFNDTSRASYVNQTTRLDDLLMIAQVVGAKTKVLVVDACRANPFADQQVRGGVSLRLSKLRALSTNTVVVFSTQPGQVAEDGHGRHSPFAQALLDSVEIPGLDIVSMFQLVAAAVTKSTSGRQTPWLDQNFIEGNSIYLGAKSGQLCDPTDVAADRAMCNALVSGNGNGLSMQGYLDCYPKGLCAANIEALVALQKSLVASASEVDAGENAEPASMSRGAGDPYRPKSVWSHNDSLVSLADNGNDRIFYYHRPRPGLIDAGVTPGTMLFKGRFSRKKMSYNGEAYIFSKKCGPVAYKVGGKVSADFRQVELRGMRPVRDASCRRIGARAEKLAFKFVTTDIPE